MGPLVVVDHWTAPLACALRVALRDNVYEFATRLGGGWRTIADWEADPEVVPKWRLQRALDAALRGADVETKVRFANLTRGDSAVWVSDSLRRNGNGGDTNRRTAAKTFVAGMAVAFMPPDALERITYTLGKPADAGYLDILERLATEGKLTAVTYRYRQLDQDVASWRLFEPVAGHLRFLDELHRDAPESTYRRSLAAAVSEVAGLAAWLSFDMDNAERAYAHYRHAVRAAGAAGDPLLGGYMLGSMSWLAAHVGDGAAALELIEAAKSKIGPIGPDTPAMSCAWLAAHEALAQATLNDTRKALTLLDSAADAVARATSETPVWPWLYPFSSDKLAAFSGSCYVRLGRANDAERVLQDALRLRSAGTRDRATILLDLAAAHLTRSPEVDADHVCQLVSEAAGIAANRGSARMWRQVREARTRLQPWGSRRAVRELDDLLCSYCA